MTPRERFRAVTSFQPFDRLPLLEWATWWDLTLERWKTEGLPERFNPLSPDLYEFFGLDPYLQTWFRPFRADAPSFRGGERYEEGMIETAQQYEEVRKFYATPEALIDPAVWSERVARQERGEAVLWITLEGFFWHPRRLFGVEDHFYAFYDEPELMHRINEDLTNQSLALLDALLPLGTPDFMTFAEDMSYNHGPMLSKELFDEFLRPYYLRLTGRLRDAGVRVFVDSDGDVTELVPWLKEVGVEGILPLERQAGVDVSALREDHPSFLLLGAFDKMTMDKGEEAMRAEFERLLPVMRGGGFLPSCDHQTPPAVSLEEYRLYLRLFREYAAKAGA